MNFENIIYTGGEEKSGVAKEILEKTGLESRPINDSLYFDESEERGGVIIKLDSDSMLEEDLSQMEKGETILEAGRHTQLVRESFRDTLKMLGGYIPQDKLQRLFPGLDLADLESYDFSLSKIRVFVLSNETYDFFNSNLYPDRDKKVSGGFTRPTVSTYSGSFVTTEMQVDMSEKKVVVIRELHDATKERIEKEKGKLPRELTDTEKDLIALNIKATITHEFLHDLDVSMDLPKPLREGITEWYAQQVANGEVGVNDVIEDKGIWVGYKNETEGVSILMTAMLESGVDMDTIDKAFLTSDAESRKQVVNFLTNRYGTEQAERIMGWKFESPRKSLQFIVDLESKQNSEIGRFLKAYEK
ncbi:MAG: hypothetical protein JW922_01875 [Paludibacteraceae bacterium]|nr:hypothetical protein [Paludibacteraceae bacterium]